MILALGLGGAEPALAGSIQVGPSFLTASATGDCGCTSTGPYVNPAPSVPTSISATGQSPHGFYTVSASAQPGFTYVTVTRNSDSRVMLTTTLTTTQVPTLGFSPDDDRFVTRYFDSSASTDNIALYYLAGMTPGTAVWTSAVAPVGPDSIGFSPSGRYLFYAYINVLGQTTLDLVDAKTGGPLFTDIFIPFIAGASGTEGLASWGFGPDDSRFVYSYTTDQFSVSWNLVNLARPPGSLPVKTLSIHPAASYQKFSPCGDVIALVQQPDLLSLAVNVDVYNTKDGTSAATPSGHTYSFPSAVTLKTTAASQVATNSGTDSALGPNTAGASCGGGTDTDLALNVPANILVPVTSSTPVPVPVTYTAPTAVDEGAETPTVSCTPASPHDFAVGTTPVLCTATDTDDTPSTVMASFTVTVTVAPPPHASFTFSPNPVARGDTVIFTDTSTAIAGIARQVWSGSITPFLLPGSPVRGKICQTVDVALTVYDNLGQSDTTPTLTIVVSATGQIISVPTGGSLPGAFVKACPGDTISLAPGTYDGGVTLDGINLQGAGAGKTILNLNVTTQTSLGVGGDVTISGVTIQNGYDGIENHGNLILIDSVVQNNGHDGIAGGGNLTLSDSVVQNNGKWGISNLGTASVSGSTIVGNGTAGQNDSGGLYNEGQLSVVNSTIANNNGWGVQNVSRTTLTNVTIAGNLLSGISSNSSLGLVNTIVAGNVGGDCSTSAFTTTSANFTQPAAGSTVSATVGDTTWMSAGQHIYVATGGYYTVSSITDATDVVLTNLGYTGDAAPGATISSGSAVGPGVSLGRVASGGHNLASDMSCPFAAVSDQNTVNPLLGPLADNGGPTPTMALGAGSPAIDAGDDASCPSTDQRGVTRPQGPHCDIGAFEHTSTGNDADLALSGVPTNFTVPATSSAGAIVSYTAPTAFDEVGDSPAATVSCTPASGSPFPIGTTTVTCTATSTNDFNSPVTASFTVTVTPLDRAAVLPAVSNGAYGGYVTAATIQNTGTAPASVHIAYFDQNGAPVGAGDSISSLPANASWTVRQDNGNSFPSSGGDAAQAGSAVVYSSQPIASFVNEFAPGNVGDATSYSGVQVPSGVGATLYAPTIVNNAYGGYTTGIGLLNEGSSATDVTITYRDGGGSVVKTQTVTALAAHAYRALYSGDTVLALPSGFAGTATISSSAGQPLGAVVNETGPGGQFSSYDAVPSGSTILYAPVALRNAYGGYNTGMGIVNTTGTGGTVTINYYDSSGTPTTTTAPIPANGSLGVYQGIDIPSDGAYTATITSSVAVAAIVNEVAPSSTSAKQSTAYNTFASGSATLHLPLVESAGSDGWSTGEGIMNTGSAATTVTVNYYDTSTGAAVGATQTLSLASNAVWGLYQPSGGLPSGARATAVITTSSGGQVAAICNESTSTTFMSYDGQ
jgi:HYR domain